MDRLQGHINQIPCGEPMSLEWPEQGLMVDYRGCESYMVADNHRHHQVPFLHMLLEEQDQQEAALPAEPSSFQLLLRLQEERLHHPQMTLQHPRSFPFPCSNEDYPPPEDARWPRPLSLELESCVTHASESLSDAMNHHQQHPCGEQQRKKPSARGCKRQPSCPGAGAATETSPATAATQAGVATTEPPCSAGEKRKRKRPRRPVRNVQEVESQRMTHIAVERNRRKLMNDHLSCLRSLMPPSFVQRGDQASIIGGAIDFVKELEQLLQSLQAETKRARDLRSARDGAAGPSTSSAAGTPFHGFFSSPQYTSYTSPGPSSTPSSSCSTSSSSSPPAPPCPLRDEQPAGVADVEATVVQTHVNLRVLTPRRPAQLLRAIAALEELHLSVLHLNVTSHDDSVFYSLNLKIEEECKLGSADEIAAAAHHIFYLISSTC